MLKREKEVPKDLLTYLEQEQRRVRAASFDGLHHFVSYPEREVKMKIVRNTPEGFQDGFYSVIIPAVDVFTRGKSPLLRPGFLKRDALSFFVSGTKEAFPFGHVYRSSGSICLGSLFVPSAVSLINVGEAILQDLLLISIVTLISTIIVMTVTGKVAQIIIERKEKNHE